tara:strand:- start:12280 stop:14070 length:1791 start_codon:yes stop_codon:yes gene_type:complete
MANVGRPRGKLALGVFRDQLYKFGKFSGHVGAFLPRNSGMGRWITNARNNAYTIARTLGTGETIASQVGKHGFKAAIGLRGGRILTGHLMGIGINAVVPSSLPPLFGRLARAQVGAAVSRSGAFNIFNRQMNSLLTGEGLIDLRGSAANKAVRKSGPLAKIQFFQSRLELRMKTYAPDVSSGQYLIGTDKKYGGGAGQKKIDEDRMMQTDGENWNLDATSYFKKDRTKRDIFGFTKPGEARRFLQKSIRQIPVTPSKSSDALAQGQILVGGEDFPWAAAVEFGGKIPYMTIPKYKGKPVHRDKYIKPSFFVHRSIEAEIKQAKEYMQFDKGEKMTWSSSSNSRRLYKQWKKIAADKGKTLAMEEKKKSFMPKSLKNSKNQFGARYKYNKKARGTAALSKMENKIPGAQITNVHGHFYSPELAKAIGVEVVPEEITFRYEASTKDDKDILRAQAEGFIKSGGEVAQGRGTGAATFKGSTKEWLAQGASGGAGRVEQAIQKAEYGSNIGNDARRAEVLKNVYNISITDKGKTRIVTLRKKRSDAGKKRGPRKNFSSGTDSEKSQGKVKQNIRVTKTVRTILDNLDIKAIEDAAKDTFY